MVARYRFCSATKPTGIRLSDYLDPKEAFEAAGLQE
jgi:hypothetical protein